MIIWKIKYFKTDPDNNDTDDDGLSDYEEVYICGTDPLLKDTGGTGEIDSVKDSDKDGLTNVEEIKLGTDPLSSDTDEDGISDYDELNNKIPTDPLKKDTDDDGISDGSEYKLGLLPNNDHTNESVSDNEYIQKEIKISTDDKLLSSVNKDSNIIMSVGIEAAGDYNECLSITPSLYSNYIKSKSVLGNIVDVTYDSRMKINKLTLDFKLNVANPKEYCIFKYYENAKILLPVETIYNNNILSYSDSTYGTYCVVNIDEWVKETSGVNDKLTSDYGNVGASESYSEPEDIFFVLFPTYYCIDQLRTGLLNASKIILNRYHDNGIDARIYFVIYTGNMVPDLNNPDKFYVDYNDIKNGDDVLESFISRSGKMMNVDICDRYVFLRTLVESKLPTYDKSLLEEEKKFNEKFNYMVAMNDSLSSIYTNNQYDEAVDSLFEIVSAPENIKRKKSIIVIDYAFSPVFQSKNLPKNYDIKTVDTINKLKNDVNADMSFIYNYGNKNEKYYLQMASDNKSFLWSEDWENTLTNMITEQIVTIPTKSISYNYSSGSIKNITLDKPISVEWLNAYNGLYSKEEIRNMNFSDTDKDGLYDFEEIDMSLFSVDESGNLIWPTFNDICNKYDISIKGIGIVSAYFKDKADIGNKVVIPLNSDPNSVDSDDDGLFDKSERTITSYNESTGETEEVVVVPKDPDPVKSNAPASIWNEHYKLLKNGSRTTHYLTDKLADDKDLLATIGSYGLGFELDEKDIALHSKEKQWQKPGGYNDLYDGVFMVGTLGNMKRKKIIYESKASTDEKTKKHALWMWKGDYLNIGSGCEIGIYSSSIGGQYGVADYRLPMTLELYNYYGADDIENVFCWYPYEKQWWITGFNYKLRDPNVDDMVLLGKVDYSSEKQLYKDLKETIMNTKRYYEERQYFIFDDETYNVWILWWNSDKFAL